jgi:membrane-associated PAP2 superfamily phosphatase
MPFRSAKPLTALTLCLLLALAAWDASGLDMALARWIGGPGGFALRDHWLLTRLLHDGAQRAGWLLAVGLCLAVWWPLGPLSRLPVGNRARLASTTLLALLVVAALKSTSHSSCPWDLAEFGGVAQYASHWSLLADGGPGRCFPAGHAATGFAFIGGYFAFRRERPALARAWLACSVAVGLLLGWGQQLRGAHFMSHTIWTGLLCWCVALSLDLAWNEWLRRQPAFVAAQDV